MTGSNYRLTLYGHLSNDEDRFVTELSACLQTDEADVRTLLTRVPVIIREGMSREQAEQLQAMCTSVRSLCLIESIQDDSLEGREPSGEDDVERAVGVQNEHTHDKDRARSNTWFVVFPAVTAILLVCLAVTFFSSVRQAYHKNQDHWSPSSKQAVETTGDHLTVGRSQPAIEIRDQIAALEEQISEQKALLKEAEQHLKELQLSPNPDSRDVVARRQDIYDIRNMIRADGDNLQSLREKLESFERGQE